MPKFFPPQPDYGPGYGAEALVHDTLKALPDDVAVFCQLRILDGHRIEREFDFLVVWPGLGLAAIEVKGGTIWAEASQWYSTDHRGREHPIKDPIEQAQRAIYALGTLIWQRLRRPLPGAVPMAVLPDTLLPVDFATPTSDPGQWVDADALADLPGRITTALRSLQPAAPEVASEADLIDVLEVRLPPQADSRRVRMHQQEVADLLTREQYATLRAIRSNDRIIVNGGAGTGKTWLALEHARQESRAGARVALICCNRGLAQHFAMTTAHWPQDQRPAFTGTLHDLALDRTGIDVPGDADSAFWDPLPTALGDSSGHAFDMLIIDEAQDIEASWWPHLLSTLQDPENGPVVIFRDDSQRVYPDCDPIPISGVEVELGTNLRNTKQIAATFQGLQGYTTELRGPDGPQPFLLPASDDDVLAVADNAVAALVASHSPPEIAVLTTHRRHPRHSETVETLGVEGYWRTFFDERDTFYTTVASFKGLERPCVVLVVNGFGTDGIERELLHVGMSRARDRLVVVAPVDLIAAIDGGAQALAEMNRA